MKDKIRNKGFTLIELLLVITILGILAAIAIPKLFPQTEKARVAEALGILSAMRQNQEAYFLQHGEFCDTGAGCPWESLGMEEPDLDAKYFTYSFELNEKASDQFIAKADRTGTSNPGGQFAGTIQLDRDGQYTCISGTARSTYPYCPKN